MGQKGSGVGGWEFGGGDDDGDDDVSRHDDDGHDDDGIVLLEGVEDSRRHQV